MKLNYKALQRQPENMLDYIDRINEIDILNYNNMQKLTKENSINKIQSIIDFLNNNRNIIALAASIEE